VGRGAPLSEAAAGSHDLIGLPFLVVSHFSLKKVRDRRAIHMIVQTEHAARLKSQFAHPQGPAFRGLEFAGQIECAKQLFALPDILHRNLPLTGCIPRNKRENDEDDGHCVNSPHVQPPEFTDYRSTGAEDSASTRDVSRTLFGRTHPPGQKVEITIVINHLWILRNAVRNISARLDSRSMYLGVAHDLFRDLLC
jgi:hypothetical protein